MMMTAVENGYHKPLLATSKTSERLKCPCETDFRETAYPAMVSAAQHVLGAAISAPIYASLTRWY